MPLELLIEGPDTAAATQDLQAKIPTATKVEQEQQSRGLVTLATVIAVFGAIGAGAKMIKDVSDMTKSVAELAKLLIEWKNESAPAEKTILKKGDSESGQETFVLKADSEPEKLSAFLEGQL